MTPTIALCKAICRPGTSCMMPTVALYKAICRPVTNCITCMHEMCEINDGLQASDMLHTPMLTGCMEQKRGGILSKQQQHGGTRQHVTHHNVSEVGRHVSVAQSTALPCYPHQLQLLLWCTAAQVELHPGQKQAVQVILYCRPAQLSWLGHHGVLNCTAAFTWLLPVKRGKYGFQKGNAPNLRCAEHCTWEGKSTSLRHSEGTEQCKDFACTIQQALFHVSATAHIAKSMSCCTFVYLQQKGCDSIHDAHLSSALGACCSDCGCFGFNS